MVTVHIVADQEAGRDAGAEENLQKLPAYFHQLVPLLTGPIK